MNSSPPPPSFTLPPLTSKVRLPITPSPTPTPNEDGTFDFDFDASATRRDRKGKGKATEVYDVSEADGRVSMYVKLFEEMIRTVLDSEAYLFSAHEEWVLRHILNLPYGPKYLLTRLLLRQPGRIHSYANIIPRYSPELGDEGTRSAAQHLALPLPIPADIQQADPIPAPTPRPPSPLRPAKSYPTPQTNPRKRKPWSDLSTGLSAEEESADPDLAEAIRESLWASKVGRVEIDDDGSVVASVTPPEKRSASDRSTPTTPTNDALPAIYTEEFSLKPKEQPPVTVFAKKHDQMSLEDLMSCIGADDLRKLARARKIPPSSLINRDAIVKALKKVAGEQTTLGFTPLSKKGKEKATVKQGTLPFTPTKAVTPSKAPTSESLLVAALLPLLGGGAIQLTPELHALIARVNLLFSRTPPLTTASSSLMLPSILVQSHKRRYPDYGPPTRSRIWNDRDELLQWERVVYWEGLVNDASGDAWAEQKRNPVPGFGQRRETVPRLEGAKIVKRVWDGIWADWQEMVKGEGGVVVDAKREEGGLVGDRFKLGHVLTRIVYKGATALGVLHEYDMECEVLKALLAQRRWRRSKRGAWYDRLALVLMNHYNASPQEKEEKRREATQICIDGLLDEDTHLIYRPGLSKRLTRLENKLELPADERHISFAALNEATTRKLIAPRVPDNAGMPKFRRESSMSVSREREASMGLGEEDADRPAGWQQVGKSVWVGRDSEVTVEGWVLEWWEAQGYKGYHSESSILTTIFALLMWPILFHPMPGAFETPYQTAPLDLGEDTFAPARADILEARLEAMSKTKVALEMLRETDIRERERGTWAVGLNWEYPREDLEELVQCIGGRALSGICRMLGEEYRHRVSGVPDLIVWHFEKREARFVEVKGPGDNLSETQRVWIDVLSSAGVPVEVCRVLADTPSASKKALEALKKRKAAEERGESVQRRKMKRERQGGWSGDEAEGGVATENDEGEGDEGEEEDEWQYESGEEGKAEGRWEKKGTKGEKRERKRSRTG